MTFATRESIALVRANYRNAKTKIKPEIDSLATFSKTRCAM